MTRTHACNPITLTRNDTNHPVLYRTPTPRFAICTSVLNNIGAARNLLEILDCASGTEDIAQIRFAIGLLLGDGFDLLRTLGDKRLQ